VAQQPAHDPKFKGLNSVVTGASMKAGNTEGGSITVPLTSCLTGLDWSVLQIKTKIVSCHTVYSKPVKQEVNGTVILPPLVFHVESRKNVAFSDKRTSLLRRGVIDHILKHYNTCPCPGPTPYPAFLLRFVSALKWLHNRKK
jgi:hypothetical protein